MTTYLHASHFHHNDLLLKILSKPLLAAALMIGYFLLLPEHSYANTQSSLLIRNVYIISADASLSAKPLNVLIKEGRINTISTEEFSADSVIDGGGQYLIPGLIDTHVHLGGVPGFIGDEQSDIYQQAMAQIPKSYLYSGFTTLLDLVTTREAIAQWNSQAIAPRAFFCAPVPIPKGYPIALVPEEIQLTVDSARYYLHDKYHTHTATPDHDIEAHSPKNLISGIKKDGALCVKAFYETGFGRLKNLPVPSKEIMRELVAEAHLQNLPVFLHGNSAESYEFALESGVDMLVHGMWHAKTKTNEEVTQIAAHLAQAKISVQPTIQVIYGEQELFNPEFFTQPDVRHIMPDELIKWYQSDAGQWMKNEMGEYFASDVKKTDEQIFQEVKAVYQPIIARVKMVSNILAKQKSLLAFGSDTPSGPIYTQFPGLNGRREMQHWIDMGVTLSDLFQALTIGNAKKMGLENEIGSVANNKTANLLLLSKNPLKDISAYDSISWVILKGKPIAREALSALHNSK